MGRCWRILLSLFILSGCAKQPGFKANDYDYRRVTPEKSLIYKDDKNQKSPIQRTSNKIVFKPTDSKWENDNLQFKAEVQFGNQSFGEVEFRGTKKDDRVLLEPTDPKLSENLKAQLICVSEGDSCDEFFIDVFYKDGEKIYHDQIIPTLKPEKRAELQGTPEPFDESDRNAGAGEDEGRDDGDSSQAGNEGETDSSDDGGSARDQFGGQAAPVPTPAPTPVPAPAPVPVPQVKKPAPLIPIEAPKQMPKPAPAPAPKAKPAPVIPIQSPKWAQKPAAPPAPQKPVAPVAPAAPAVAPKPAPVAPAPKPAPAPVPPAPKPAAPAPQVKKPAPIIPIAPPKPAQKPAPAPAPAPKPTPAPAPVAPAPKSAAPAKPVTPIAPPPATPVQPPKVAPKPVPAPVPVQPPVVKKPTPPVSVTTTTTTTTTSSTVVAKPKKIIKDGAEGAEKKQISYVGTSDEEVYKMFKMKPPTTQAQEPKAPPQTPPVATPAPAPAPAPEKEPSTGKVPGSGGSQTNTHETDHFLKYQVKNQIKGSPVAGGLTNATNFDELSQLPGIHFFIINPNHRNPDYFGSFDLAVVMRKLGDILQTLMPGKKLGITSISNYRGGKIPPHTGHQNGTDADIRYLTEDDGRGDFVDRYGNVSRELKIDKQWKLLKAAVETDMIEAIFVDRHIRRELCREARRSQDLRSGDSNSPGVKVLQKIQSWPGHDDHFHVRAKCTRNNEKCVPMPISAQPPGC